MWFVYALICLLGWGFADLFYKKSADPDDRYSHLKVAVWVGLVMGVCALILLPFCEHGFAVLNLENLVKYSPASLAYIISMVIGYAGMRYLEISIISPVQNASGALSTVVMVAYFLFVGRMTSITEEFSTLDIVGTALIVAGVIALAVVEHRLSRAEREHAEKKYRFGALALLFPIAYCICDTIGTAADGIILDEEVGLGLGDLDVLVLYGLTFLAAGVIAWIYVRLRTKKAYNPFAGRELRTKGVAACFEEFGQVFYVFAMSRNPVVAAPMVASYCIVSVILSRIFLKEKLSAAQYVCVVAVIAGIVLLGVSEGLGEMAA